MINYIINLDRRKDKWEETVKNINSSKELSKETFIRISAFDGFNYKNEITKYKLENNVVYNYLKTYNIPIALGAYGCYMSHLIVLYNILYNHDIKDDDYVGIYEDDFQLATNFEKKYKKFKKINLHELGVEFIYLGGRFEPHFKCEGLEKTTHPNVFYRKDKENISKHNWDRTTHAYVIKKNICKKLITLLTTKFIDNILVFQHIDWIYIKLYKDIKMFDYFQHLYYSEINYKTDIQLEKNMKLCILE
jgi:GR25 family glycosyltransferase involved in LPS biosynthesis